MGPARTQDGTPMVRRRRFTLAAVSALYLGIYVLRDSGGAPVAPGARGVVDDVLVGIAVLTVVRATRPGTRFALAHLWAAFGTVGVSVVAGITEVAWLFRLSNLLSAYLIGASAYLVFRFVLRTRRVSADTFMGALAVYLAVGVLFGVVFTTIAVESPGSFDPPEFTRYGGASALYYYSFVALTSLGFGDITPVSSLTRVLTTMEAMLGLVIFAALVGRIVGLSTALFAEPHGEYDPLPADEATAADVPGEE